MEPEEEEAIVAARHYVYNPYVLCLLYAKVQSLARLLGALGDADDALLRHNAYDRALVADVDALAREMARETFRFDLYHANYEYGLLRLMALTGQVSLGADWSWPELGDLYACDLKLLVVLDEAPQNRALLAAALLAVARHRYAPQERDCGAEAAQRATLLLSVKRAQERALLRRRDRDYTLVYSKDIVATLLAACLVDEALALAQLAVARRALRHCVVLQALPSNEWSAAADEEARVAQQDAAETQTLEARVALLRRLHAVLLQQYEDEFRGFSCIQVCPQHHQQEEADRFADYTRVGCVRDAVTGVRSTARDFVVTRRDTRNLRYVNLALNLAHYEYAARRFLFDHALLARHPCREYRAQNEALCDFYAQCEARAYHACHYVQRDAPQLANEAQLHDFLASVVLERVPPLHGVIYKNFWQLARLWRSGPLFEALDVEALVDAICRDYDTAEGGCEARVTTVLRQCVQRSRRARQPTTVLQTVVRRWHRRLALDIDVVLCLMRALAEQRAAARQRDDEAHTALMCALMEHYTRYAAVLSEALGQ